MKILLDATEQAFIWATVVGGPNAVPFGSLAKGESFSFPKSDLVHVKTGIGRYRDSNGRRWQTGNKVAVIPVEN